MAFAVLLQAPPGTSGTTAPVHVIVDNAASNSTSSLWQNPAAWAVAVTLLAALIAAATAMRQNALQRAAARREVLARQYGDALADALGWLELPFRVARRVNDEDETIAALVEHMHLLQERIEHQRQWLSVESETVGSAYGDLVGAAKSAAESAIKQAWQRSPVSTAAGQVLQDFDYRPDVSHECAAYLNVARAQIADATQVRWLRDPTNK